MAYLHTIQQGYVPLRSAEVTTDESPLDSSTSGNTFWDMTDKDVYELGEEANGICVYFAAGDTGDGSVGTCHAFGKAVHGPAEKIAEMSLTFGAAYWQGTLPGEGTSKADSTEYLMVDTIAIDSTNEFHIRDVDYFDTANNRAAKLTFDTTGLKFLYFCFTKSSAHRIVPYGRVY